MASTEQQCGSGHFYNPSKFSSCPYCGVSGIDLGPTLPLGGGGARRSAAADSPTGPLKESPTTPLGKIRKPTDEQPTVGRYSSKAQDGAVTRVDPIVGWLVCAEGPDKGRDFRVKAEKNFIGRSTSMDICISGDERISRENHAVIAFEPRRAEFRLYPGDARGLVYLNSNLVDAPALLAPYDSIELGGSKLLFIPFCGERFKWPE